MWGIRSVNEQPNVVSNLNMKLTRTEYDALLKRNPKLHPEDTRQSSKLEQDHKNEQVEFSQVKEGNTFKGLICITDVRKRLLDDDNLAEKFHVDCLRYEKIIQGDSTGYFRIFTTQRKCTKEESPHTLIEIY